MPKRQNFVLIFGPPAVGKFSVGQELALITDYKLLHNHLAIECTLPLFEFGTEKFREMVAAILRQSFFFASQSDLLGLIFTFVWAFNRPSDYALVSEWCQIFRKQKWDIYFLELAASLDVRLERNRSPSRLIKKPSKRDLVKSERILLNDEATWQLNSSGTADAFGLANGYARINNDNLSPRDTAELARSLLRLGSVVDVTLKPPPS